MKQISIIGGGISGLAVLHYLKQRFGHSVDIKLYEREASLGGTIRSIKVNSGLFEWGPNGFLNNQPETLELLCELGIADQLIEASPLARRRYIQRDGSLYAVPMDPWALIQTPLLTFRDKCSLMTGILKKNISKDSSIHQYVSQRFSPGVAEAFVDPLITGIYAGNIKRLHMASAFPKFKRNGFKKSRMLSFEGGMGQVIGALENRYKAFIQTNCEITQIHSDISIVATPAYAAAKIVENINPVLARLLGQMPYAPVAVAGLLFQSDAFRHKPEGFGYLVPSRENKDILGLLIESNVYAGRADNSNVMIRVLLGGAHHPGIINDDQQTLVSKAIKEIDTIYGLKSNPLETGVKLWPQAIPQYEINYPSWRQSITEQCANTPGLYLCANYLNGVSFNDCIKNAKAVAQRIVG